MCDNIAATRRKTTGKLLESISLNVHINNRRFGVVCAYKPNSVDNTEFTSELTTLLDQAMVSCDTVICSGDLNCDILHPQDGKKEGKCLLDICDMYDFDSIINESTRISTTKESCLDVILTHQRLLRDQDRAVRQNSHCHPRANISNLKPNVAKATDESLV